VAYAHGAPAPETGGVLPNESQMMPICRPSQGAFKVTFERASGDGARASHHRNLSMCSGSSAQHPDFFWRSCGMRCGARPILTGLRQVATHACDCCRPSGSGTRECDALFSQTGPLGGARTAAAITALHCERAFLLGQFLADRKQTCT